MYNLTDNYIYDTFTGKPVDMGNVTVTPTPVQNWWSDQSLQNELTRLQTANRNLRNAQRALIEELNRTRELADRYFTELCGEDI